MLRWLRRLLRYKPLAFRYERFGGIAQLRWPRALVFVDQDRARALGYQAPPPGLWTKQSAPQADPGAPAPRRPGDPAVPAPRRPGAPPMDDAPALGLLSAPLEAHLQLTNRCAVGCQGCYTGATPAGAPGEWGLEQWSNAVDRLAQAGVFHLALGGGESATLPWLGDLLRHARGRGVVPNLTTSGIYDDQVLSRLCAWAGAGLFGQINLSLDGIGAGYAAVRGVDGFAQADRALVALRKHTPDVGINCVVTRENFAALDEIFAHARKRRLNEIELLRFKPAGRGARAATYDRLRCTDEQNQKLLPLVLDLSRRHRLRVRLDCSYTPMVAHHRPDPRLLRWLSIYGCAGGDMLIAARATGALSPCSFAPPVQATVDRTAAYWHEPGAFGAFRGWPAAQEPCQSCDYLPLCRGGCRVVSAHVSGDWAAPDPECPRVIAYRAADQAQGPQPPERQDGRPAPKLRLPVVQ